MDAGHDRLEVEGPAGNPIDVGGEGVPPDGGAVVTTMEVPVQPVLAAVTMNLALST